MGTSAKTPTRTADVSLGKAAEKTILKFLIVILTGAFLLAPGCPKRKQSSADAEHLYSRLLFYVEETPCYGFCPVYQAWIREDGTVYWIGRHFVETTGKAICTVDSSRIQEIHRLWQELPWDAYDSAYVDWNITDIPSHFLAIFQKSDTFTVFVRGPREAPPELMRAISTLREILTRHTACTQVDSLPATLPQFVLPRRPGSSPRKKDIR